MNKLRHALLKNINEWLMYSKMTNKFKRKVRIIYFD